MFELGYFRSNPRPFFLLAKVRWECGVEVRRPHRAHHSAPQRTTAQRVGGGGRHSSVGLVAWARTHPPRRPVPAGLLPTQELFPGNYLPTPTHFFMKLLHDKGLLLRCFTQARAHAAEAWAAVAASPAPPAWHCPHPHSACQNPPLARAPSLLPPLHPCSSQTLPLRNMSDAAVPTLPTPLPLLSRTSTLWSIRRACPPRRWWRRTATLTARAASSAGARTTRNTCGKRCLPGTATRVTA